MLFNISMDEDTYDIGTSKERLVVTIVLAVKLCPVFELDGSVRSCRDVLKWIDLIALMARINICCIRNDLVTEVGLFCRIYQVISSPSNSIPYDYLLFPTANLKATNQASSAMLKATEPCDNGNIVRFDGPAALPHGAVLSCAASQIRSAGHMKATGPISVPSAPSPCVCAWLRERSDTKTGRRVERILLGQAKLNKGQNVFQRAVYRLTIRPTSAI